MIKIKIKIEVDDKNLDLAKDISKEIMFDLLAKYPFAEANVANRDFKNAFVLRVP